MYRHLYSKKWRAYERERHREKTHKGRLAFVELKAEGKKLRPLQEKRKNTAIFQKKPLKDTKRHLSSLAFCDMIILEKVSRACTVTITVRALIVFGGNIIPYLSK